jgi:hypothetical protein
MLLSRTTWCGGVRVEMLKIFLNFVVYDVKGLNGADGDIFKKRFAFFAFANSMVAFF